MKSKILPCLMLLALCMFASCKKSVNVETSKIDGMLAGAFKVAAQEYEVTEDKNGNPIVRIEIKRTDESVPYTKESLKPFGFKGQEGAVTLAGFGYIGLDADGKEIINVPARENDYDTDNQIDILTMGNGDSDELIIKLDKDKIPAQIQITSEVVLVNTGVIDLYGAVGQYGTKNWTMEFNFKQGTAKGRYQYLSSPAGAFLYVNGTVTKNTIKSGLFAFNFNFKEDNGFGSISGDFTGSIRLERKSPTAPYYYAIDGSYINFQGRNFSLNINSAPLK